MQSHPSDPLSLTPTIFGVNID